MVGLLLVIALWLFSCGGSRDSSGEQELRLSVNTTWYIQLQGEIDTNKDVELYDIDLFDVSEDTVRLLKSRGKIVICYFNAGAYENWRPDKDRFPADAIGKPLEGWEGERWLDVRRREVREIMLGRLRLAKEKGCDGVDPDNVNGYENDTGFNITYEDQLDYNLFLSREAHRLGLLIGLKNDGNQVRELVDSFDFSVQEECHQYNECHLYYPFVERGKPVFNIEYERIDNLCSQAESEGFMTAIYNLELDGSTFIPCW